MEKTGIVIRSHERIDYKRCPKKWFWRWRMGLVPKATTFGALDLGTWMHEALASWYGIGLQRNGALADLFNNAASTAYVEAQRAGAPEHVLDKADELAVLGEAMAGAYQVHYKGDPNVNVIAAELPLGFTIPDESGGVAAVHLLKPDLVFSDSAGDVWLMEHKTAAQVRTEHLVIDDQARPYGAMAERALRKLGLVGHARFKGIMYNYLRKGLPDERPTNDDGRALNKNGSVSRRQPSPLFVRKPIFLTGKAKATSLRRIQTETVLITMLTESLKSGRVLSDTLPKTPHSSCPRFCQYFAICSAEEDGIDITEMRRSLYRRENPYDYAETTDEPIGFEMG